MQASSCLRRISVGATVAVASILLVVSAPVSADSGRSAYVLPADDALGQSYGAWSAAWWQWAVSTTASCAADLTGRVWFLAGSTGGHVDRTCTIPTGAAIMIPIINGEWSAVEANAQTPPGCWLPGVRPNGAADTALSACAKAQIDYVTTLQASIDNTQLTGLSQYRAASQPFSLKAVPGNVVGFPIPGVTTRSVADGYWLMFAPLDPGRHSLSARGVADFSSVFGPGSIFDEGVTFTLSVYP